MRRRFAFFILLAAVTYYLRTPAPEESPRIDAIKVKMSATARLPTAAPALKQLPSAEDLPATPEPSGTEEASFVSSAADVHEDAHLEHLEDEVPWDEIQAGWKTHLREYLLDIDPDRGEEYFNAYLEEKDKFDAEMAALNQQMGLEADQEPRPEFVEHVNQLERNYEEKLKSVLGPYYQNVTDYHQQYNSSVQYLNRSGASSQIWVSL
jgi:hypothetical protein